MSRPIARRGTLLLAAVAALIVAAFAAVPAAEASTVYACVTKGGSAHVYTKKPKKCKKGEKLVSWNTVGPAGANGKNGTNGTNGANGANGAVAGFSAVQTSNLVITEDEVLTQLPGLTKALPAGSFIVSADVDVSGADPVVDKNEYVGAECAVIDTPTSGTATKDGNTWASLTGPIIFVYATEGVITVQLPVTTSTPSTLSVKCREAGRGENIEEVAGGGTLVAIQTSGNS